MAMQFVEALESRCLLSSGETWAPALTQIRLDAARQDFPQYTGKGQTVALIDVGIDYMHPDLGGGLGTGFKVIAGYDFVDGDGSPVPVDAEDSHGTGTAGMLAGNRYVDDEGLIHEGVAPDVNVIALRTDLSTASVKAAIYWVLKNQKTYNIVAANINAQNPEELGKPLRSLQRAKIFVGAPSGNEGKLRHAIEPWGHGVVMTGSTNRLDRVANFTQVGPGLDMLAPGTQLTVPWYVWGNHVRLPSDGSSWSSPMVVATAALIKQVNPAYTPTEITAILKDSGRPIQYAGKHTPIYPELDVDAALTLAVKRAKAARAQRRAQAAAAHAKPAMVKPTVFATGNAAEAQKADDSVLTGRWDVLRG